CGVPERAVGQTGRRDDGAAQRQCRRRQENGRGRGEDIPQGAGTGVTSPERNFTVAVAQIASVLGDVTANQRKHLDVVDAARSSGIDVLVFPEMSLTGHAAGPETLSLALRRDNPVIAEIARASSAMCTVFGLIEEGPAAQFYNAAIAVRDGAILAVHRKVN